MRKGRREKKRGTQGKLFRQRRNSNIQGILWKNYVFMVLISSVLILIPFFLILLFSNLYKENLAVEKYSAASLLEEYRNEILEGENASVLSGQYRNNGEKTSVLSGQRRNNGESTSVLSGQHWNNGENASLLQNPDNVSDAVTQLTKLEVFSRILDNRGGVQVVSEQLKVRDLGGISRIEKQSFSMSEWTEFLKDLNYRQDGYSYSVEYQEGIGWVIVEFPVSILFVLFVDSNSDSVDFPLMCVTMIGIFILYLLLLGMSAVIYSRRTAKSLVWPIQELCQSMRHFKEGKAVERMEWNAGVPKELRELREDFFQMEEQLTRQEAEKEELYENRKRLVRDISHDLKNPLAGILGYAELLQTKEFETETQKEYLSIIYQNSVRANKLIQSLFEYSKLESADFILNKKQEDLCELLRLKLVEFLPLFDEKGFLLEAEIPEEEWLIPLDAGLFGRIFDNLFENALRYNEAGTRVSVSLKAVSVSEVCILVADDGIGMDETFAKTVFDAFSREENSARNSEKGGSGLGLAIVRQIVELHGGTIVLYTRKGEGSRFEINFRF